MTPKPPIMEPNSSMEEENIKSDCDEYKLFFIVQLPGPFPITEPLATALSAS